MQEKRTVVDFGWLVFCAMLCTFFQCNIADNTKRIADSLEKIASK